MMSASKMSRRRRHDRRKRILAERRENALFHGRGTIPASATAFATCPCGARAFARNGETIDDFDAAHAYCEDAWSA